MLADNDDNKKGATEEQLSEELSRVLLTEAEEEVDGLDEDLVTYISGMLAAKMDEDEHGSSDDAIDEAIEEVLVPFLENVECPDHLVQQAKQSISELFRQEQQHKQQDSSSLAANRHKSAASTTRKLAQGVVSMSSDLDGSTAAEDDANRFLWGKEGGVKATHNTLIDAYSTQQENLASSKEKRRTRKKELEKARKLLSSQTDEDIDASGGGLVKMKYQDFTSSGAGTKDKKKDIQVRNVTVSLDNGTVLMENSELKFAYQRRYGLIGENGVGKSTLLKHIAHGEEMKDFPSHLRVLHVRQEVPAHLSQELTVVQAVLQSDVERNHLLQTEKDLLAKLEMADGGEDASGASGGDDVAATQSLEEKRKKLTKKQENEGSSVAEMQSDLKKLDHIYARLQTLGSDTAQSRAAVILSGLQFSPEQQKQPVTDLSGGWKMRVALAGASFILIRFPLVPSVVVFLFAALCLVFDILSGIARHVLVDQLQRACGIRVTHTVCLRPAAALFIQPELLMLDEPTNHLGTYRHFFVVEYTPNALATIALTLSKSST